MSIQLWMLYHVSVTVGCIHLPRTGGESNSARGDPFPGWTSSIGESLGEDDDGACTAATMLLFSLSIRISAVESCSWHRARSSSASSNRLRIAATSERSAVHYTPKWT